jgi:hypothetical protein
MLLPLASRSAFNPGVQVCAPARPPSVISGLIPSQKRATRVPTASGTIVTTMPATRTLAKNEPPLVRYASTACGRRASRPRQ